MLPTEFRFALGLVTATAAVVVLYAGRTLLAGKQRSERASQLGGSMMLGKWAMEMGYWALAPPRGTMRRHERLIYLLVGAALTALFVPATAAPPLRPADWPMWAALALVALVGNLSAVLRLRETARLVRRRGGARP